MISSVFFLISSALIVLMLCMLKIKILKSKKPTAVDRSNDAGDVNNFWGKSIKKSLFAKTKIPFQTFKNS